MTEIQKIKEGLESIKSFVEVLKDKPKVHCIVNDVAATLAANVLLAVGAQPSMTNDPFEVTAFTESADALSINLGMLTNDKRLAIGAASKCAKKKNIPWVMDVTMIERSSLRLEYCQELLQNRPTVIRGNEIEVNALCRHLNLTKTELCKKHSTILVATGEIDTVDSSKKSCELKQLGHPWMSKVSGMGCTLSALIAAMLTVYDDPFDASVNTMFLYGVIGKRAANASQGPGTFVNTFIDHLAV